MPLKLRPTGLGAGIDKDRAGLHRLQRRRASAGSTKAWRSDRLRWFWSLTVNGQWRAPTSVATLEEAKAQFQRSWDAWKAWANLEEID